MMHNRAHAPTPIPTVEAVDNLEIGCGEGLTLDVAAGKLVDEPVIRTTVSAEDGVEIVDNVDEGSEDVKLIVALPIVDIPYM
jgi:hypothetical protein